MSEEAQRGGPRSMPALGDGPGSALPGVTRDPFPVLSPGLKSAGLVLLYSIGEREFQHQSLTGVDVDFFLLLQGFFFHSNRKEMC